MSIDKQIPVLQAAIWLRLEGRSHLRSAGLLDRLAADTGMHPQDVRRALARLRERGWLQGVAMSGEPIGQVIVLEERPKVSEPESLTLWTAALVKTGHSVEDQQCLAGLHFTFDGFESDDLTRLAYGLLRLRDEYQTQGPDPAFVVSARHLLGSAKLLGAMPATTIRRFIGKEPAWPDQIPYIVTAGPGAPASVILIENPWAFERALELGLAQRHALVVTFGYGLVRNGEAFGRQLAQQVETGTHKLLQLRRLGDPPDLLQLFTHSNITFWGDLDPEGLRIYTRLKARLPSLTLSPLYEPMRLQLLREGGHPYHLATAKGGQVPITLSELERFPDIGPLAQTCTLRGLDQEALSAEAFRSFLIGITD